MRNWVRGFPAVAGNLVICEHSLWDLNVEQLFSPLIVHTTPEHAELKELAHFRAPANAGLLDHMRASSSWLLDTLTRVTGRSITCDAAEDKAQLRQADGIQQDRPLAPGVSCR